MRARFREQVREDVKTAALRQLADGGAAAISVNAIAKQLGVSGPALYRYFANRDELLGELVVDAYLDFAAALATATDRDLGLSPPDRLRALADAWHGFAHAEPTATCCCSPRPCLATTRTASLPSPRPAA